MSVKNKKLLLPLLALLLALLTACGAEAMLFPRRKAQGCGGKDFTEICLHQYPPTYDYTSRHRIRNKKLQKVLIS